MRLICPGCGAQYEVDDGVIPDAGRDVQCSACGRVWFQKSRPILLSEEEAVVLPDDDWEHEPIGAGALRDRLVAEDPEDIEEVRPAPKAGAVPRRSLDDGLLSILREEAAREAQARRADGNLPETQEEMILEPAPQANPALSLPRVFAAPEDGVPPPFFRSRPPPFVVQPIPAPVESPAEAIVLSPAFDDPVEEAEVVSLPDIGEINSSLRASADRVGEAAALDAPQVLEGRRSGFRLGFGAVMLAAALATAAYGFAPRIGAAVPALAPALEGYVAQVNAGRVWLDEGLRGAISGVQRVLRG